MLCVLTAAFGLNLSALAFRFQWAFFVCICKIAFCRLCPYILREYLLFFPPLGMLQHQNTVYGGRRSLIFFEARKKRHLRFLYISWLWKENRNKLLVRAHVTAVDVPRQCSCVRHNEVGVDGWGIVSMCKWPLCRSTSSTAGVVRPLYLKSARRQKSCSGVTGC